MRSQSSGEKKSDGAITMGDNKRAYIFLGGYSTECNVHWSGKDCYTPKTDEDNVSSRTSVMSKHYDSSLQLE